MGDAKTPDAMVKARLDAAKTLLSQHGYVVLKAKSYRAAQQRQHIAEAIAKYADDGWESTRRWAETNLHNEIRELMARCTFLYGAARAHGATVNELAGNMCPKCNDRGTGALNNGEPQTVTLSGAEYERYLDGALNPPEPTHG